MNSADFVDLNVAKSRTGSVACERLDLFPIPVFRWTWRDAQAHKSAILAAIRQRQLRDAGMVRSNREGWHSQTDLPIWPELAIKELVQWCVRCVEASTLAWQDHPSAEPIGSWLMDGWANINPPGGAHNISHTHSQKNWHWSASYYVDLAEIREGDNRGGALVLEERGTGIHLAGAGRVSRLHRIVPAEGELIVFPSWLYHRVEKHQGGGDRVTIAFNLYNSALERARLWEHRPRWWWRRFPDLMRRLARARGTPDLSLNAAPDGWEV